MSITYHERPGVYADYDASAVYTTGNGAKTVAVIATGPSQSGPYTLTSAEGIEALFGSWTQLTKLVRLAFYGGAAKVLAFSVEDDSLASYESAFEAVFALKAASYCVIGSCKQEIQCALKAAVEVASQSNAECIGIVGMSAATDEQRIARAAALNSARMVLVAPQVYWGRVLQSSAFAAAALAGVLAAQTDPALPLNGVVLPQLNGVSGVWTDDALDTLLTGGVTPLELVGGQVRVIRAVTTCTTVNGVVDTTWRELNTTLVIDDVIPSIRSALQTRFARAKNNAATRSAIRNLVVVQLESRVAAQVIDGYENLTVTANATDPTVCDVRFSFAVTHGLNRIVLTAHITV